MFCPKCGKATTGTEAFCASCGAPLQGQGQAAGPGQAQAPAPGQYQPPYPGQPLDPAATSGMGNQSILPPELKGWNWGGFFLNWIWSIGNSVWIGLLGLIPVGIVGLVMSFVLGAKGNEWAWGARKWDSVEHFRKTQKTWAIAGLIVFLVGIFLLILYIVLVIAAASSVE